jgi:hypothetical protein
MNKFLIYWYCGFEPGVFKNTKRGIESFVRSLTSVRYDELDGLGHEEGLRKWRKSNQTRRHRVAKRVIDEYVAWCKALQEIM